MSPTRRVGVSILTVLLAAHLLGGGSVTLALLSDSEAVPVTFATAACFTTDVVPPSVSRTVISKTPQYLPGYIPQGGTYYIYAEVADLVCGVATVTADVATVTTGQITVPLVAGSYSVGGINYNYRSASVTANGTLAAGAKAYTLTSTDTATNSQTQTGFSVIVDNTRPSATDVQALNGGLLPGTAEAGDTVTLTHAEIIDPESVLVAWTGAATSVVVRIANQGGGDRLTIRDAANTAQLPLGTVNLNGTAYVTVDRDFGATGTPSTMVQSGSLITITLGTPSGATGTQIVVGAMSYTPTNSLSDRAGNTCQTPAANESGIADVEF
jgi:predicted ribosomally synthesized peptide with SipW-like signal peptide